jgi:hypothetical protein
VKVIELAWVWHCGNGGVFERAESLNWHPHWRVGWGPLIEPSIICWWAEPYKDITRVLLMILRATSLQRKWINLRFLFPDLFSSVNGVLAFEEIRRCISSIGFRLLDYFIVTPVRVIVFTRITPDQCISWRLGHGGPWRGPNSDFRSRTLYMDIVGDNYLVVVSCISLFMTKCGKCYEQPMTFKGIEVEQTQKGHHFATLVNFAKLQVCARCMFRLGRIYIFTGCSCGPWISQPGQAT